MSRDDPTTVQSVVGIILVAIGAYLASFFIIYFNVALAAAADQALRGAEPDTRAARAVARSRIVQIAGWALVSVVVSALLALIRDRAGAAGGLIAGIGGAIWGLVTFMVVPVLAFEGIGPIAAIKRSAHLFRQRWGQQVTGNVAIGGIAGLVLLVAILIGVGGVFLLAAGNAAADVFGVGAARPRLRHRHRVGGLRRCDEGCVRRRAVPLRRRGPRDRAVHDSGPRERGQDALTSAR